MLAIVSEELWLVGIPTQISSKVGPFSYLRIQTFPKIGSVFASMTTTSVHICSD